MRLIAILLSVMLCAEAMPAQQPGLLPASPGETKPTKGKKLWYLSLGALAAANVLDARSSWGKREANPFLAAPGATFGAGSVGIKAGVLAGVVGAQYLLSRTVLKRRSYGVVAGCNFAAAGALTAVAARNYTIRTPRAAPPASVVSGE